MTVLYKKDIIIIVEAYKEEAGITLHDLNWHKKEKNGWKEWYKVSNLTDHISLWTLDLISSGECHI